MCARRAALISSLLSGAWPSSLVAQHEAAATSSMDSPMASGTSWVPLSSPIRGAHFMVAGWTAMVHGVAYGQYSDQAGRRGGWQVGSINWLMLSATHATAGGRVELRAMGSAEPYTLGKVGYPLLLQTGETYKRLPLHDRQHPHDLAMELSATYEQRLAGPVAASVYLAAVGEPAAGPVAYMHRPSSAGDPFAPLSHHWQDGDHVTFGVMTAGLFTRHVKLEGSLFNGREPDEVRTNFDYRGRRLDSWAARLTILPARDWAVSGWYAYLESPEALYPADWNKHVGASVLHSRGIGRDGVWSSAVIWGAKRHEPSLRHPITRLTQSVTAESSVEIGRRNTLFGRAEYVQKDMDELFLPHVREQLQQVRSVAAGYVFDAVRARRGTLGIGVRGALNFIPDSLATFYGDRRLAGGAVFVRLGFERSRSGNNAHAGHAEHAGH